MPRFLKNKEAAIGQIPGAAIFIGKKKMDYSEINIIDYTEDQLDEASINKIESLAKFKDQKSVTWINVNGLQDAKLISKLGKVFSLHPLTIEDLLHTGQRPKVEEYDNYLFFLMKMLVINPSTRKIESEQFSIILGDNFLITFQESVGEVFESLRNRIRKQKGRIRKNQTDYLAYALLDTVIDNYILLIGQLGEEIEEIENKVINNPTKEILLKIYSLKQEVNYLRKCIRPSRDFILHLSHIDSDLIREQTSPFLKDLLDLATQAVEIIDVYREMLSDHLDIYNTGINNRLNEIMKVLTIFSVVFIPLTFIAGIYGTNFEYIPELKYRYGYFIFWGVLVITAIGMLTYFKRKKWI